MPSKSLVLETWRVARPAKLFLPAVSLASAFCAVAAAQPSCDQAPLNVMVQAASIPESSVSFDGLLTLSIDDRALIEVSTPVGKKAGATFYAAIVSQGLDSGVQGWSFSIAVDGMKAKEGTLHGTASEPAFEGGFRLLQVVDPTRPCGGGEPQGEGFVSAVVLSLTQPVTLLPTGTATVIALTVESAGPQGSEPIEGRIDWKDGLAGSG